MTHVRNASWGHPRSPGVRVTIPMTIVYERNVHIQLSNICAVDQNHGTLVTIKIAGKWMSIPKRMVS